MLLLVIVLAANAAEESLKVYKLKYFYLVIYGSTTILAYYLHLRVLYFHMEVFASFVVPSPARWFPL
jgi:hypothetical protein